MTIHSSELVFSDRASLADFKVFGERLSAVADDAVRLLTNGRILTVFGCTHAPANLTDAMPLIIVARSFKLASPTQVDETVQVRGLLDRIANLTEDETALQVPPMSVSTAWAGVLPPRSGWHSQGIIDAPSLSLVASQGAARVADMLPTNPGEAVVQRVRREVWSAQVAPGVPAGAAFAADAAGFLHSQEQVTVSTSLSWLRLTTSHGDVFVRDSGISVLGVGSSL